MAKLNRKRVIFSSDNPYWETFINCLEGNECNLDHASARKILETLAQLKDKDPQLNIDVEGALDWFKSKGGYCDCEIILNIDLNDMYHGPESCNDASSS